MQLFVLTALRDSPMFLYIFPGIIIQIDLVSGFHVRIVPFVELDQGFGRLVAWLRKNSAEIFSIKSLSCTMSNCSSDWVVVTV